MPDRSLDNHLLDPVPLHIFFFAEVLPPAMADIVIVRTAPAMAGRSYHRGSAEATINLSGEHIVSISPMTALGIRFCFQTLGHLQK